MSRSPPAPPVETPALQYVVTFLNVFVLAQGGYQEVWRREAAQELAAPRFARIFSR
jgi:hypothetical protein